MAITLPKLPYSLDALEPSMSHETLELHYGKHHQHYVDMVNELTAGTEYDGKELEEILHSSFQKDQKIYENAAQAWNHTFFWNCMSDNAKGPSTDVLRILEESFGSFDSFMDDFSKQAKDLFGSGWTWLVKDQSGELKIVSWSNEGNPLAENGDIPILCCDVWEHAYYLDYQNDRPHYLENFWQVVNWKFVEENLQQEAKEMRRSSPNKQISMSADM